MCVDFSLTPVGIWGALYWTRQGATDRRQILGRRRRTLSISLLTWSGRVSHDLHDSRIRGQYFNNLTLQGINCRIGPRARLPGEHRYRGEYDYGADSGFADRPSNEMVRSWNHAGAHAAFERDRVCAIGVAPVLTVLATFQILRRAAASPCLSTCARSSIHRCGERTNTKPRV